MAAAGCGTQAKGAPWRGMFTPSPVGAVSGCESLTAVHLTHRATLFAGRARSHRSTLQSAVFVARRRIFEQIVEVDLEPLLHRVEFH